MRELGADDVIDYTKEDFADPRRQYDLIVDIVGYRSISTWKAALKPQGIYMVAGGSVYKIVSTLLAGAWVSATSQKRMGMLAVRPNKQDLRSLLELVESGTIRPTIDRSYPLPDVPEAIRYLGEGHSRGKVVISFP